MFMRKDCIPGSVSFDQIINKTLILFCIYARTKLYSLYYSIIITACFCPIKADVFINFKWSIPFTIFFSGFCGLCSIFGFPGFQI